LVILLQLVLLRAINVSRTGQWCVMVIWDQR